MARANAPARAEFIIYAGCRRCSFARTFLEKELEKGIERVRRKCGSEVRLDRCGMETESLDFGEREGM